MSGRWREGFGIALLVLGVATATWLTLANGAGGAAATGGSSHSPDPGGTLALYQWLERGGYGVTRLEGATPFRDALADADVLWVIGPESDFSDSQAQAVTSWVSGGGTLILASEGGGLTQDPLRGRLGIALNPLLPPVAGVLAVQQPVFGHPPAAGLAVNTGWTLNMPDPKVVPLVSAGPDPVLATFRLGAGRVFALSSPQSLANAALDRVYNGPVAWNLAAQGRGRRQLFDEVHHGYAGSDLRTRLLSQPWGWAALYALAVIVGAGILRGQRLGPPQLLVADDARRGTMDYVHSLAGLFGRAGRTEWAAARYAARFRRALAAGVGLDPQTPTPALVAAVAAARPGRIEAAALQTLLARLDAAATATPRLTPGALLRLVQEAEGVRAQVEE